MREREIEKRKKKEIRNKEEREKIKTEIRPSQI
jgi:hypothetical protein